MHGRLRDGMVIASFSLSRMARDELDRIANDKGFVNRSDLLRFIIVEFLDLGEFLVVLQFLHLQL